MRLVLVTPSSSYRIGDFLTAAVAMGCEVLVVTDREAAVPGSSICVDLQDAEAAARKLVRVVGDVDGVVGTDGAGVAVAAELARLLGLSTNPSDATRAAGNKLLQRRAAAVAGVPQPGFALFARDDDPEWSTFPAVVKPLDRAASQGVIRADSAGELRDAATTVREIVGASAPLLVEAFVPGTEVVVEGLLAGGRLRVVAVFDKPDTPDGPTFPETLLVTPARLSPSTLATVVDVADRAVGAIGLTEGPVHVECIVGRGGQVWFLELAARTIGGLCSRSLHHQNGPSLEELVIAHALGRSVPITHPAGTSSGVLMLPAPITGTVAAVRGVEAARRVAGVTEVTMSVAAGQRVVALPAGDRYLGFVFAEAETPDETERALRTAWAAIEIDITAS